jgi:hypothetical protein
MCHYPQTKIFLLRIVSVPSAGKVAQVVEWPPSKCEALSKKNPILPPSPPKKTIIFSESRLVPHTYNPIFLVG